MIKLFVTWLGSLAVFLLMDMAWLGMVARSFYHTRLAGVVDMQVNWPVAALFYMLHVIGLMVFVIVPSSGVANGFSSVLLRGALYGLFTYATYDLTNLATIRNWPVALVVVDVAWGMVLNAIVSVAGFWILRRLG